MTDQSLLPCPFCGGEATRRYNHAHFVGCRNCCLRMKREAWNTRHPQPDAGMRWQDISTAPMDGTRILAYVNNEYFVAFFDCDKDMWMISGESCIDDPEKWRRIPAVQPKSAKECTHARICDCFLNELRDQGKYDYPIITPPDKPPATGGDETKFWRDKWTEEVNTHAEVMRDNARLRGLLADKTEGLEKVREALQMNQAVYEMYLTVDSGDIGAEQLSNSTNKAIELNEQALATLDSIMGVK